jgi:hypothetical protein
MTPAEQYRVKAMEFAANAKTEGDPHIRTELEALSLSYRRLAEQADRNAQTDVTYETPIHTPGNAQQQQQQQPRPKPDKL